MTRTDADERRRAELGQFLRARREAISPRDRGLAVRRRRRTRGLLREEVADIAGVSLTWYTWLEQARPTNPSVKVLDGLATALGLAPVERAHLFRLARPDLETVCPATDVLAPAHVATLHGLAPHPVYASNARWDVLAWNVPAARVFGDFAALAPLERNVLHRLLLDRSWQALFVDWERLAVSAIAQFRATSVHLAGPALDELIAALHASPLFAAAWTSHAIAEPLPCRKTLRHPTAGTLAFDYATLRPEGETSDLRFTMYTPADAATAAGMRRMLSR